MGDAPTLLRQAAVLVVVALAYALISQVLTLFPYIDPAMLVALAATGLCGVALGRGRPRIGAACAFIAAAAAAAGLIAVFYDLLLLVPPARIGMVGLVLAYVEGALLGVASHAAFRASVQIWRASRRPWWAPEASKGIRWRRRREPDLPPPPAL